MGQWEFDFARMLSAIGESVGLFLKYIQLGLLTGIVFAGIFTFLFRRLYRRRAANDDSKVMYGFALFLLWSGWTLSMMITGAFGGALAAYQQVLVRGLHTQPQLFSSREIAEVYIILGQLENLTEQSSYAVGAQIQAELDAYHDSGRLQLYSLVTATNRFVTKLPQIMDRQLKLPEIAKELNQYGNALNIGCVFSPDDLRSTIVATLNSDPGVRTFLSLCRWFFYFSNFFEIFLKEHPEFQGAVTVDQCCEAQIHFLLDHFLNDLFLMRFLGYLRVALLVVATATLGGFALIFFWTRPREKSSPSPSQPAEESEKK